MREIRRDILTLWTGQSLKPALCATCRRPTYSRWEEESGLIEIRACSFACAQAEYKRRIGIDHADGYHDDAPRRHCADCGTLPRQDTSDVAVILDSNQASLINTASAMPLPLQWPGLPGESEKR